MPIKSIVLKDSCVKTLAAVEAYPERSRQHEFNGVAELKKIFGSDRQAFEASFSIRGEDVACLAKVTWYDSREKHATRSEYRLYFQKNQVMKQAQEGDSILIGFDKSGLLHCILVRNRTGSGAASIFRYESWTSVE